MRKHLILLSFIFLLHSEQNLFAQTVPSAQSLIYTQDFSSLSSSSTTYTTGFQGWAVGSSSSSSFRTTAPTGDQALNGSSSASSTTGGVHNYNGKIGILASGSVDPSLAFVVNTTGFTNVKVTFDVMTIRNPYDGSSNTRLNNVELQYLVGSSVGAFTDASGSIYRNNTTTQTGSGVTTPQNVKTITITLPSGCNNQSAVQLRWVQRDSSGSGSRASFAFDNICVTGTSAITTSGSTTFCSGGSVSLTAVTGSSYLWSTGATTKGITATTSGTYSVTTTQATGCSSASSPVTVTVNTAPTPTVTASPSFTICNGQSTTLTASGGTSYSWNTGATTSVLSVSPTTTTIYTVTVSNSGGCSATATKTVTVGAINVSVTPTSTTICSGTNTTLTANGATTYAWSPSTGLNTTTGTTVIASPTSNTTYTVTGTSGSCSNTQTSAITVNPVTTITVSPSSASICIGSSTNLTASGSTSYSWSPSTGLNTTTGTTVTANPTVTTTYTVTGSCNQKTNVTVTVNPLPTLTVTSSPSSTICTGNSASLSASGATTYAWSPSTGLNSTTGVTVTASPTTTTTYTVTGTNSNGCIGTKTISITVNPLPSLTVSPTSATICAGNSTSLTVSGASTYAWSPSTGLNTTTGTTVTANPTVTTTYTVTGTNSNGCLNTKTVIVTINASPNVSVSPSNPAVCNGSGATLTASGATTYAWSPSTALNTTTGATVIANPTTTTTYTVTGTSSGCSASAVSTVSVIIVGGGTAHASGGSDICSNSAVSLTLTGLTGTFVKWQSSTDNINYADVPGGTTQSFSTSVNTSTYFRAQVTSGSCPAVYSAAAHYVTNNNYYVNDNSTSGDIFCTAVGSNSNDGRSPARPMASINNVFATYTISACDTIFVDKGTYSGETDIYSGNGGNSHGNVTVFGAGVSNTILNAPTNSHNFYIGTNYIKIQNVAMNNTNLSYYNVEIYEAAHNIITNTKLSHTADANVVIFGDNINSNGNQILNNSITNSSNASSSGIYNGIFVEGKCDSLTVQGDSITMTSANTIDAILITTYSNGSTNYYPSHGLINQNTISAYTYGVSLYGYDYPISTYTVSSNNITMQASSTTDGGPVWLGSVGASSAYQSVIYDNRLIGGKNGIYFAFSANYTKSYNNYISGSSYGLYVYDVTSNNNELYFNSFYNTTNNLFYYSTSCSSWNVRNNILYNTGSSSSNACMNLGASSTYTVCDYNLFYNPNGASVGKIGSNTYSTLTAWQAVDHASGTPNGDEHSKSGNPLYANASSNNLDITSSSPASATGTTISGITKDIYNNTRTSPPSIGADDVPPVPSITAAPSLTICSGASETLTANAGGGTGQTYLWNPGSATTSAITINPTTTTNYSVTVNYSGGYSVTATKNITVNPLPTPTVTASPSFTICNGQSTSLTASGGTNYSWNTGATTVTIAVSPTTTTSYTATVTNSNGCVATAIRTITVNPLPTLTITPSSAAICNGSSINLTASGASTYVWSPSTGLNSTTGTTVTANPTITTTYTVVGTSSAGCNSTTTITITVNPLPTPTVTASPSFTICTGQTTTLTASGGTSYSWNTGATTATLTINPTTTTSYTATVTNSNGCVATATNTITVNPLPTLTITSSSASICNGSSTNLTANGASTYVWSPSAGLNSTTGTTVTASPTITTTYTVVGTSSAGCNSSSTISITVNPLPTLTLTASSSSLCIGNSTTLNATGANIYAWSPTTGLITTTGSTVVASPTITTTYTVTGTSVVGCSSNTTQAIVINSLPVANAGSNVTLNLGQSVTLGTAPVSGNTYSWSPTAGLNNPNIANPNASPAITTTYSLTVSNANGCTSMDSVTVKVSNLVISINNASGFALLSGGNITSSDSVYATGKVGAIGTISNNISASDSIIHNSAAVHSALNTVQHFMDSLSGFQGQILSSSLDGLTLSPGIYDISDSAVLNGFLTLTGDSTSVYFFHAGNTGTLRNLRVGKNAFIKLQNVNPQNVYWYASTISLDSNISFWGVLLSKGSITESGSNYGETALIAQGDIHLTGKIKSLYSQNEMFKNPVTNSVCSCYNMTSVTESARAFFLTPMSQPIHTLSPCTNYSFQYNIQASCSSSGLISDWITIKLPDGIEMSSTAFNFYTSGSGTVTLVSPPNIPTSSPVFSITNWNAANGVFPLFITITAETPPCASIPNTPSFTTVSGTNTCVPNSPITVSNILSIATPALSVLNLTSGPLLLNTGDVTELVFEIKNVSVSIGTDINSINVNYIPDPTTTLKGYYLTTAAPSSLPIPVSNSYAYNFAQLTYSPMPLLSFLIGQNDFNTLFPNNNIPQNVFPYGQTFYLHIAFEVPWNVSSTGLCNSPIASTGSYSFTVNCGLTQTPCNNTTKTENTSVNVLTDQPALQATALTGSAFTNANFVPLSGHNSAQVGFQYINNGNSLHQTPAGCAKATDLILYLYSDNTFGTLDPNSFAINTFSISPSIVTHYSNTYPQGNSDVWQIDFTQLPVGSSNIWNPFGSNTIADIDGKVDDLKEGDSFTITATFNYQTNTCPADFGTCRFNGSYVVGVSSRYNNQCFATPISTPTSTPSCNYPNCKQCFPFDVYSPCGEDAEYFYQASGVDGSPIVNISGPDLVDVLEGPFTLEVCPGTYTEEWGPIGFDFNCPNGYHQLSVALPPGYHLQSPVPPQFLSPIWVTENQGCGGLSAQVTPSLQEICPDVSTNTPGYVLVNFGRLPYSPCTWGNVSYQLPCIDIPLYITCPTPTVSLCPLPTNTVDITGTTPDIFSASLQYICAPSYSTCASGIDCASGKFTHHCLGQCVPGGYFSTDQGTFSFERTNTGYVNPSTYYDNCTQVPTPLSTSNSVYPVNLRSAYHGDVIEVKVSGKFDGLVSVPSRLPVTANYQTIVSPKIRTGS